MKRSEVRVRPSGPSRDRVTVTPTVGRYSVQKFLDLHDYSQRTSPWRAWWVQMSLPLPGLMAALLPALIPLEPLRRGVTKAFVAHLFCIAVCISWGTIVLVLSISRIPASVYSRREIVAVTLLCAVIDTALISLICVAWRFPMPFAWVGGSCVWTFSLVLAHLIVLRSKCWRETQLLMAVKQNQAALSLEVTQVVLYPAISILFDRVGQTYQVLLTLAFPLIKFVLKKALQKVTTNIEDQHGLVVVSAIEIFSSLYQSIIMQSAPSKVAMAIIMGVDFIQGLFAIKFFLDRPTHAVSRHELVPRAVELLQANRIPPSYAAASQPTSVVPVSTRGPVKPAPKPATLSDSDNAVVREALQLAYAAETIVLLEYYEVIVPLLNCVYIVVAAQFQAALYNTKLRGFYLDGDKLSGAVASILLYSLLQGLSCVVMHLVMKYRYGVSASYLLAFVLERHRRAIQAKMIAWLPIILNFSTVHYGTDFSFRFHFSSWVQW